MEEKIKPRLETISCLGYDGLMEAFNSEDLNCGAQYCTLTLCTRPLGFFNERRFIINKNFISDGEVKYD
jgi:hypothetical protein